MDRELIISSTSSEAKADRVLAEEELWEVCSKDSPLDLSEHISIVDKFPFISGGFGDVYKGVWKDGYGLGNNREVAIKVIRPVVEGRQLQTMKRVGLIIGTTLMH